MRCVAPSTVFLLLAATGAALPARAQEWIPPQVIEPGTTTDWGCYDPLPAHPTASERQAFVAAASAAALDAERETGVPAPALAAMAMVESGYGWTRTALFANNYFGWKASEGDPAAYRLWCQPSWDKNADYVKFPSLAASVAKVAARLRDSVYYRQDTKQFQSALAAGQDRNAAVLFWLAGIADPYNYSPAQYVKAVRRIMNDPLKPSDAVNPATTLYRLDPAQSP